MIPRFGEWDERYRARGLVTVGVHAPETDAERDLSSLAGYVRAHHIAWAVAVDDDFAAWRRWAVDAWPTVVLVDRRGVVRGAWVGEGHDAAIERAIEAALAE